MEVLRTFLEPPLVYALAAGMAVLLAASLLLTRYVNRRYVELRRNEVTEQLAFHLARIAESLESLAASNAKLQQRMETALEKIALASRTGAGPEPGERRPRIKPYAHELGPWSEKISGQDAENQPQGE